MQEGYLKALRLRNIQSWKDLTLEFSSGLNVIEARNESGKSVPIKVKRAMLMPMFFDGDMSKVIRRRDEDIGEAWWYYTDFTIKFEIYPTYQIYRLLSVEGVELESWKQNTLPRRLKDLLHIYYDQDEMVILNIIDQEMGLIFDSTSPSFNATVLNFFAEDADLSKSAESLNEWIEELQKARRQEIMNKKYLAQLTEVHKYIDLDTFRDNINSREKILTILDFLVNFQENLDDLLNTDRRAFNRIDDTKVDSIINCIRLSEDVHTHLNDFIRNMEIRRDFNIINEKEVQSIIDTLSLLHHIDIKEYEKTVSIRKEFKHIDDVKVERVIINRDQLNIVVKSLKDLENLQSKRRKFTETKEETLQQLLENIDSLTHIYKRLYHVNDINSKRVTLRNHINRLSTRMKEFKEENSICPLCEQPFERGHNHE